MAEYREQPHDHLPVALGGRLAYAAMTLQPLLIIRDMGIDHIGNRHRQRRDEPAIDEKGDEAPRPSHISTGELFAPSAAAAAAHVLCEPLHDLAVDVDQGDVGLSQPCGEMASRICAVGDGQTRW